MPQRPPPASVTIDAQARCLLPSRGGGVSMSAPLTARREFWRRASAGAFPWLRAVVSMRHGGTSGEPFASLNLGRSTGDDVGCVDANRARVVAALGLADVHLLHQVHGTDVFDVPGTHPQA